MLSSPRSPDTTIRIFSSAEYCLRVLRRISRTALSTGSFLLIDFCLIFVPFGHYDEPEILRYAITSICPKGADVRHLFGLAPNARLKAVLAPEAWEAARLCRTTGKAARLFRDFAYQTETSWSRPRRVVGKAEHLPDGANPRFVVTSLGREKIDARGLYEDLYCARGEMENRIKECQLDLFADRTSSATMQANQLRLWFASMAYVLLSELRRIALRHTQFADATCGTIRLKLLKIGALVRRSVRRIKFAMASGFPWQTEFALAYLYLQRAFPR